MLTILPERELNFIDFLNKNYPLHSDIRLSVLQGYDAVQSDKSGNCGFAVFLPQENIIMLPTDVPDEVKAMNDEEFTRDFVIHNLAHEYAHALQFNGVREFEESRMEEDADAFADKAVEEFNSLIKKVCVAN